MELNNRERDYKIQGFWIDPQPGKLRDLGGEYYSMSR